MSATNDAERSGDRNHLDSKTRGARRQVEQPCRFIVAAMQSTIAYKKGCLGSVARAYRPMPRVMKDYSGESDDGSRSTLRTTTISMARVSGASARPNCLRAEWINESVSSGVNRSAHFHLPEKPV